MAEGHQGKHALWDGHVVLPILVLQCSGIAQGPLIACAHS